MKINQNFNQNSQSNSNVKSTSVIEDGYGSRLYHYLGIYVSRDGKNIYKLDPATGNKTCYNIKTAPNGNLYIDENGKWFYVNYLVAVCFKPAPKDGRKYEIYHIDGNPSNCDADNLGWRLPQPKPANQLGANNTASIPAPNMSPYQQTQQKMPYSLNTCPECKIGKLTINRDGEVFERGKKLNMNDSIFDSDTALTVCISPYVRPSNGKRYHMDDLVIMARYVQGTPDGKTNPKILHKDHDCNNYASLNLEWVDENSLEYQEYRTAEKEFTKKRNIELNPGVDFPEFMQPK